MERFFYESELALDEAVTKLQSLGTAAKKLLAECVAAQGVTRKSVSAAATALDNAGFVFIRDNGDMFAPEFEITPSLAGEEALEALEERMEKKPTRK